jgi:hypothetical protein
VLATSLGEAPEVPEAALVVDELAVLADVVDLVGVGVGAILKVVLVTTPLNGPLEELLPLGAAGTSVAVVALLPPAGGRVPDGRAGTPAIESKLAQAIRDLLAK